MFCLRGDACQPPSLLFHLASFLYHSSQKRAARGHATVFVRVKTKDRRERTMANGKLRNSKVNKESTQRSRSIQDEKDRRRVYTGYYRNLFKEYGYAESEINAKVEKTWNDRFYGDEETRIYYPAGDDAGYILDTGYLDVRTEGMSTG